MREKSKISEEDEVVRVAKRLLKRLPRNHKPHPIESVHHETLEMLKAAFPNFHSVHLMSWLLCIVIADKSKVCMTFDDKLELLKIYRKAGAAYQAEKWKRFQANHPY